MMASQADLRRAVSSAYYSLFHLLVASSIERMGLQATPLLAARIARSFSHSEMKQACRTVSANQLTPILQILVPNGFSTELLYVAERFIELQAERHIADYDIAGSFDHAEVIQLLETVRQAFAVWASVSKTPEADVFLAALLFNSRWSK